MILADTGQRFAEIRRRQRETNGKVAFVVALRP